MPIVNGTPAWHAAARSSVGGAPLTEQLAALLRVRFPPLAASGGLLADAGGAAEALKASRCAVAADYGALLRGVAAAPATAGAPFAAAACWLPAAGCLPALLMLPSRC